MESGKDKEPSGWDKYIFAVKALSRAEGRAAGMAEAVLGVLEARGLAVSPAQRQRVLAEWDQRILDRWVTRAATCASTDEALRDER